MTHCHIFHQHKKKLKQTIMNRRKFIGMAATASAALAAGQASAATAQQSKTSKHAAASGLHVRFIGTGAADWNGRDERGECRRFSSILLDKRILIDFTAQGFDMMPQGCRPEVIFYTHSHNDHYNPEAALKLGVKRVYLHQSWFDRATAEFSAASQSTGLPMPTIIPICIAQTITEGDLTFTPLPANHATSHIMEQTVIYLVQKGATRLLYATDTGGLTGVATRYAGIDGHTQQSRPITALIMEATMGMEHEIDFRFFTHSSVATVQKTVQVLTMTKRYLPPAGQPVYITHMARGLFGTHAETEKALPAPLRPAYDGLEVTFK